MHNPPLNPRTIPAGDQVILNTPGRYLRIIEGDLVAYIGEIRNGVPAKRLFGSLLPAGSILFTLDPEDLCLFARAETPALIEEIILSDLLGCEGIMQAWGVWIQNPLLSGEKKVSSNVIVVSQVTKEIPAGALFRINCGKGPVAACRVSQGTVYDTCSDMSFTKEDGWFPAHDESVFSVHEAAAVEATPLQEALPAMSPGQIDAVCRRWAGRRMNQRWQEATENEDKRISSWNLNENQISEYIRDDNLEVDPGQEDTWVVFRRVLRSTGIDYQGTAPQDPPGSLEKDKFVLLSRFADHCGVRIRRVRLDAGWWNEDNGSLLLADNERGVLAAIPDRPGHYCIYDARKVIATGAEILDLPLDQMAFMLYPTLPERVLQFTDVTRLLLNSLWKRDIAVLILFGVLAGALTTVVPIATGLIFGNAIPDGDRYQLTLIILVLFVSMVSSFCFQVTRSFSIFRMEGRIGVVFEAAIWDRLLRLPTRFFRQFNAGELSSRAGTADGLRMIFSGLTISVILGAVFSVFNIVIMFLTMPEVAGLVIVVVACVFIITVAIGYLSIVERTKQIAIDGHLSGITFQMLSNIAKISSAGAQRRAYLRWRKDYRELNRLSLKISMFNAYSQMINSVWPVMLTILIFAMTGLAIYNTSISGYGGSDIMLGRFLTFFAAVGGFSAAFISLGNTLVSIWNVKPMWDWMSPILTAEPEAHEGQTHPGTLTGTVELSHISFRYSEDRPYVLRDVSLQVSPGGFIAIVGPSGSGKSTLIRILLGFEKPESGSVMYNGQNLDRLNIREVRKQIGVVLQDGQLMADTIFNNIAGAHALSHEDAWVAAKMAGIDEDIRQMPMEMQTFINEGATNLSGGQKQRILIARAIAVQPKIILLDEATSALDNTSQNIVRESLERLNLTRIVIAHRLSSIRYADYIYVMDEGAIVEEGSYENLMQKGGVFTALASRQVT